MTKGYLGATDDLRTKRNPLDVGELGQQGRLDHDLTVT